VSFSETLDAQKEEEFAAMLTAAGDIVSQMKRTPRSSVAAMLRRFRRHLNDQVKEEVRDGLYREIATALEDGGIPPGVIDAMTTVFVNILVEGIELVHRRSQDFVWGWAWFFSKKVDDFFSPVALKTRSKTTKLTTPTSNSAKNVLKSTLALPGGALGVLGGCTYQFSVYITPKFFFSALGVQVHPLHPLATVNLRLKFL